MNYGKKIFEYIVGNFKIYTGFGNYKQAEEFAQKTNGELTEIVYHDGKIEPEFSDKAKLVEKKMPFNVELSKDYTVFYSNDEFFEKYTPAEHEQNYDCENQNTLNAQNVIIFNGDYHNSPCLKERLKKLANSHFYELAVKVSI